MKILPCDEIGCPTTGVSQLLRFREVCLFPPQFLRQQLLLVTSIVVPRNPLKTPSSKTGTPTQRTYRTSPSDRTTRLVTSQPQRCSCIILMVSSIEARSSGWTAARYCSRFGGPFRGSRPKILYTSSDQ